VSAPYFVAIIDPDRNERDVKGWELGSKDSEWRRCSHSSRDSRQGLLDDDLLVGHDISSLTRNTTLQSVFLKSLDRASAKQGRMGLVGGVSFVHHSGLGSNLPWTWRDINLS